MVWRGREGRKTVTVNGRETTEALSRSFQNNRLKRLKGNCWDKKLMTLGRKFHADDNDLLSLLFEFEYRSFYLFKVILAEWSIERNRKRVVRKIAWTGGNERRRNVVRQWVGMTQRRNCKKKKGKEEEKINCKKTGQEKAKASLLNAMMKTRMNSRSVLFSTQWILF